ncbi:MAG: M50 family metallopeptidase [Ilumatobacteraceae bacterium]
MSDTYRRLRDNIGAGGDSSDAPVEEQNRFTSIAVGLVIVGLLVWLGVSNPWSLVFVVGLIVSVFLHEVGHFVTARRTGMKVTQFFMGMGPRIWSTHRNGVEYGVRALPIGAYVRIVGMNNMDECEPADEPYAYRSKSYPRKLLVISAGSLMHMVIALALFFGVFATAGRYDETGRVRVVYDAAEGSPAERAGIQQDDVILSVAGQKVSTRYEFIVQIVDRDAGDIVDVVYERDGVQRTVTVELVANPRNPDIGYIGLGTESAGYVRQSPIGAIGHAFGDLGTTVVDSVSGVFVVLNPRNIVDSVVSENPDPTTRPTTVIGATQFGGDVGESEGLKGILMMLAFVNVFFGVFNMFPLLPFDGGHVAIATYERIRSRRGKQYHADASKMVPVAVVVTVLMAMLFLTGSYLDIVKPL